MLNLTRGVGQKILIGTGETLTTVLVIGIKGNKVQLGVAAPKDMPVYREELYREGIESNAKPDTPGAWQSRVRSEKAELNERLRQLRVFISTDTKLEGVDRMLLHMQADAMNAYSAALNSQIERFEP